MNESIYTYNTRIWILLTDIGYYDWLRLTAALKGSEIMGTFMEGFASLAKRYLRYGRRPNAPNDTGTQYIVILPVHDILYII